MRSKSLSSLDFSRALSKLQVMDLDFWLKAIGEDLQNRDKKLRKA